MITPIPQAASKLSLMHPDVTKSLATKVLYQAILRFVGLHFYYYTAKSREHEYFL
jgi:hypothetical protein